MRSYLVTDSRLRRELGTVDAVIVGLSAMIGTGVFVVWQPAVAAAGGLVVTSLLLAAGVAWLNATSTAGLAAIHPRAGGVYHYGRARLGPTWGSLAGFAFAVGKTMSAATAALAVGTYLWPDHSVVVAVEIGRASRRGRVWRWVVVDDGVEQWDAL